MDRPHYQSGEAICVGDIVKLGDHEGVVEEIITCQSDDWEQYWKNLGEGVMLKSPTFGRVYVELHDTELVFVRRG